MKIFDKYPDEVDPILHPDDIAPIAYLAYPPFIH